MMAPARLLLRQLRASWRDTFLLLREFRLALLFFLLAICGSGVLYYFLAKGGPDALDSLPRAIYHTLTLTFLQPSETFPGEWFLQVFYFLMPLAGVAVLAQGLADFGSLLFNRRSRGKEWEMAVASTYNNHVIVVGLGHLGFRVMEQLRELNQDVVVVEKQPEADLLHRARAMDVPVITDDGAREAVLVAAGTAKASAIILCTQNDSLNLRMALKARSINPKIEVVMRIFDEEFGASLESQFGFHVMSATRMAAPVFAAYAAQVDFTSPIVIEGKPHILGNLVIGPRSRLRGHSVLALEEKFHVSIVLLCADGQKQFHPAGGESIETGHTVAVFGEPEHINQLFHENQR
jgi:Trk K+ transport system NAD-binding subunit